MSAVLESITHVEEAGNATTGVDAGATGGESAPESAAGAGDGAGGGSAESGAAGASRTGAQSGDSGVSQGAAKQDVVPHAALHEARSELKQLRAKIAEMESQPRLTAEEQAILKELRETRSTANQAKDPDFLEDPKGYIDANVSKALKKLESLESGTKETQQTLEQQRFVQAVAANAQQQEATFVKQSPDYHEAIIHARTVRANQLKMLFPQATDEQVSQQVMQEEFGAAAQVLRAGGNVAEFAYNYAKTLGYQPKAQTKDQGKQPDKSAARTLGSGGGAQGEEEDDTGKIPEFTAALQERFGVRKRK